MQAAIEIPTPNPSDSDTVVTALETAAVFSAKGDTAEAIRWVQRAAESAGDAGDDARTLTLARTAAELTRSLQSVAPAEPVSSATPSDPSHARRLPKPPPRQSSSFPAAPARAAEDEAAGAMSRRPEPSRTPPPVAAAPMSTRPPPPPSARVTTTPSLTPRHAGASGSAGTASVAPRTTSSSQLRTPSVDRRRPLGATPSPSSVAPRSESRAETSARSEASTTSSTNGSAHAEPSEPAAEVVTSAPPQAPEAPVASAPVVSAPVASAPSLEPPPKPSASNSQRPAEASVGPNRLRSAARVSVVASSTEPGLFFVRLLDEGQAPPSSSAEALMVLLDPASTLFSN